MINKVQIRRNEEVTENQNDELEFKYYPKNNKMIIEKAKLDIECPSCKQRSWTEFDRGSCCQNCQYIVDRGEHKFDYKVLRQIVIFLKDYPMSKKKI